GTRVTFACNALSDRTLMQDGNGRTISSYDDARRLKTVINPAAKKITYALDAVGQRSVLVEPGGGRFTYTFDDAGRIRRLLNPHAETTSWTYDDADRVIVQRLANGIRASHTYDDANQVTRLANIRSDSTTISSFDYALDPVGNRTRVQESTGARVT